VTYGLAAVGLRTAHSFVPEFESELPKERLSVKDFTTRMRDFYLKRWKDFEPSLSEPYTGPNMTFVVAGFDDDQPYGQVWEFGIPNPLELLERQPVDSFGVTWGGQREVVDRLVQGFDYRVPEILTSCLGLSSEQEKMVMTALQSVQMQMPLQAMALQDCVDLALFFIRTTISAQQMTVGVRGCGGAIDVATITGRDGISFVQRKRIRGESAQ
jgi:hypothetical protein